MRRIVFCPSESMIGEASLLAKKNNLPINVGDFDQSANLIFKRDIVQVLEIPEDRFVYFDQNVKCFFHQNIIYNNDFLTLNKNLILQINNINYFPIIMEKHKACFNLYETIVENKKCNLIQDDQILESFEYYVY